ncbi:type VI secretion system-associated protein TagF, partial [Mesorhizobium sp. M7A.F.Ca.CA.001.05.1.1]
GEAIDGMVVWTATSDLYDVDPEEPTKILESLLAVSGEIC